MLLTRVPGQKSVSERSQFWPHVGSVTLTFAALCFCSLKGYCLYIIGCLGEPWPSAWILNQNAFLLDSVCLQVAPGKNKLTHPLLRAYHSRRYLQDCLFTLLPHLPHLCSIKRTWQPHPSKMVILRHLSAIFLVSQLIPCLRTPCLLVNWPGMWPVERAWTP